MLGKNDILVDRNIYTFKGSWKSPNNDKTEPIFYFISSPMTMRTNTRNGVDEIAETMEITIFGEKPICSYDEITLQTGEKLRVDTFTPIFAEHCIEVRDLLKPRVVNMILTLV